MGLFNFGKKKENDESVKASGFHITIRNNETGDILHDADTVAYICAYDHGEKTAGTYGLKQAKTFEVASVVMATQDQIAKLLNKNPELAFIVSLEKVMREKEEQSDEC